MNDLQNNSSSFLTPFSPIQEEENNDEIENIEENTEDNILVEETTTPNNFNLTQPDHHSTEEKSIKELKEENWNSIDGLNGLKTNTEVVETENKQTKPTSKIVEEKKETKIDETQTIELEKSPTLQENELLDKEKIKTTILLMQSKLNEILNLLDGTSNEGERETTGNSYTENGHKIVEGLFNGKSMIGPDGREYSVPANYASKSRLVDGDSLKLTIKENGSFVYKQIKPTDRKRITGTLVYDEENDQWITMHDGKSIKVLNASISFYKGKSGDNVVLLVPKEKESHWGAVENIIKKSF